MIIIKPLTTKEMIDDACRLLYDVYIENMKWEFGEDNASEIKIIEKNGKKLLVDKFIDCGVWFGAYERSHMVGCARLCGMDANGKFEVQGYQSAKRIQKYLNKNCMEAGKVAVDITHRGKKILEKLYLAMLEYALNHELNIFGCVSNAYVRSLFNRINLPLLEENAFKYENQDLSAVNFYMIDYKKGEYKEVIKRLNNLINVQSKSHFLDALNDVASVVPVPMYWHDLDHKILGINELCLRGLGVTKLEDVLGKTPYDLYPKEIADRITTHNKRVISSGEVLSQEEEFRYLSTGKIGYAKAIKSPLYDNTGRIIGVLGVSIDITSEKEAEKLRIANEKQQVALDANMKLVTCLSEIQHIVQDYKISFLNEKLSEYALNGIAANFKNQLSQKIKLTKREREILYFLSLNKSPKEIATILSGLENKPLSSATILSIIDKQLYIKFEVFNVSQLIEKANSLKLIPFILN